MAALDVIAHRLRSHRLTAPAASPVAAARHMLAVQAQEFWGGRWALAVRSRGAITMPEVDAAFERGELVRAWPMRGTLHIVPAEDLAWMLSVTGERQFRQAAPRHRDLALDAETFARAEALARAALAGGSRLTRAEFPAMLAAGGVDPAGQRGIHVLHVLALRGVLVWGPVVPREGGASREQYLVLAEDWIGDPHVPADPLAELAARFVASHAPAGARDLAWWAGLPLGTARAAMAAAGERIVAVEDGTDPLHVAAQAPPRRAASAAPLLALPPFEEYYISYADRTRVCAPEFLTAVGPAKNGIVRPILLDRGRVIGVWTHSLAVGRHGEPPEPQLFADADAAEVAAALERYADFVGRAG
ncbi:winged helix DNA-binding domain-containing protein [Microbacterium lushaniae]|nr:winged helix DNA-binding domain-containing protein [Microbacterium lushaniae]KAA9153749.1 winged helix DNA-binding domain-containing protein [Microbacterium lushaniae]